MWGRGDKGGATVHDNDNRKVNKNPPKPNIKIPLLWLLFIQSNLFSENMSFIHDLLTKKKH